MLPQSVYRPLSMLVPWIIELGHICRSFLYFLNEYYKLKFRPLHHYSVHELTLLLPLQCSRHWTSTAARLSYVILQPFTLPTSSRWYPCRYVCPDSHANFFFSVLTNIFLGVLCIFLSVFTLWEHMVWLCTYVEFSTYEPFIVFYLIRWFLFLSVRSYPNIFVIVSSTRV